LSLIRDLHEFSTIRQRHARCVLFGRDGSRLSLVLDKGDTAAARNHSDFAEAFESTKYGRQSFDIVVIGQVLHEQDLVWWEILVGHNGSSGRSGGLEARTTSCLRRSVRVGWLSCTRSLEAFLFLGRFGGFFLVYYS
jgi:hypothetical protein